MTRHLHALPRRQIAINLAHASIQILLILVQAHAIITFEFSAFALQRLNAPLQVSKWTLKVEIKGHHHDPPPPSIIGRMMRKTSVCSIFISRRSQPQHTGARAAR